MIHHIYPKGSREGRDCVGETVSMHENPLVSVVTPVHNREDFLAECIESVLSQSYENFEYIIVDNCSTDRSLEIALDYAKKDSRIRVHSNKRSVGIMENHNIGLSLISPAAKYCKVLSDFDFIFPDCIMRMVELAEANPSVGIVGSYQLAESRIRWQGFKYPRTIFSGREVCRQVFLGGQPGFGFGTPTSIMYRTDLVRNSEGFYPNSSPHADTSACFKYLENSDFGFVYQVLSYARVHGETESSKSSEFNRFLPANLNDLIQYGSFYLTEEEFRARLKEQLNDYHRFLGVNIFRNRGKEFWRYHKDRLAELGYPLSSFHLLKASVIMAMRAVLNLELVIRRCWTVISRCWRKAVENWAGRIGWIILYAINYGGPYGD